jgi:hypothetical protein
MEERKSFSFMWFSELLLSGWDALRSSEYRGFAKVSRSPFLLYRELRLLRKKMSAVLI